MGSLLLIAINIPVYRRTVSENRKLRDCGSSRGTARNGPGPHNTPASQRAPIPGTACGIGPCLSHSGREDRPKLSKQVPLADHHV